MTEQLDVVGGLPIRVSRAEIERVAAQVAASAHSLLAAVSLGDALSHPIESVQMAMHLPRLLSQFERIQTGCQLAAEHYFGVEQSVTQNLAELADFNVSGLAAGAIGATAPLGLLRERSVSVTRIGFAGDQVAPRTAIALATRLKQAGENANPDSYAEIRIERYGNHVVAYIPGTQNWSLKSGANPLDMTSNAHAMTNDQLAASQRAVQDALALARVGAGDSVLLVGHSQGGIVAASIASSLHDYTVAGIVTFGSPIAGKQIQPSVQVLAFEHSNDPVPKLDGQPNPIAKNVLTVTSRMDAPGLDTPLDAHAMTGYQQTAGEADLSGDLRLRAKLRWLADFVGDRPGRVEWFAASRLENADDSKDPAGDH